MRHRLVPRLALVALALACGGHAADAAPAYRPAGEVALGAPDRWDYVVADAATGRVYVAHGSEVAVVDGRAGTVVGKVEGIAGGSHGTAVSAATHQGYTDDGRSGQAIAFDLTTFKTTATIPAADDADAIVADPMTGHIFVVEGDPGSITVIDPVRNRVVDTIKVGEKMEYAAAAPNGFVYVAGEEKSDVVKIDARSNKVVARWPAPNCRSPHGLAYDAVGERIFVGCVNSLMMVVDGRSGRVVAELPIGRGNDAVAFDPVRRRVFSSNGLDGTVSIFQQMSPDDYRALDPLPTAISGRTMAVDPTTGRVFVAAADTDPSPTPGGRPKVRPGTLRLMLFDPVDTPVTAPASAGR